MAGRVPLKIVGKMLGSPELIATGIRQAIRKRVTSKWDFDRGDGFSAAPVQLDMKLVDSCNLRCRMCPQWGENGYNFTRPSEELRNILPLETYKKVADDLAAVKPWVYLWGGEPFLYPHVMELIAYLKSKSFPVTVVTNGTRFGKNIRQLVEMGLDVVMFSIDGPRDTHDNIRGYRGAFSMAESAMHEFQEEKRRQRKPKPYIILNSVFTRDNQDLLHEVYQLGETVRADMVFSCFGWYQTADSGARQVAFAREKIGVDAWSWKGWMWSFHEIDPAAVIATVRRIRSRKWSFAYSMFPDLSDEDIPVYYKEHSATFGHKTCVSPWIAAQIMPNGDVVTCRDYPDVVVGNIRTDSVATIWNNPASRQFRTVLTRDGLMPICSRCQGLMCL
jgi:radical SAM protein with 4Fe4S-binding SPASM domain